MADISKWFENKVKAQGELIQSKFPVKWHRFPDAHSARGAVASQPGDFMLVSKEAASLIEVKTSEDKLSLKACAAGHIRKEQIGHHLLWNRAGHPSYFMFMSDFNSIIELWDGGYVAQARRSGTKLDTSKRLDSAEYSDDFIYSMLLKIITRSY